MNDKNDINNKNDTNNIEDNNEENSHVAYGVAFGLIGGAAFSSIVGLLFEFPLIWAFGPGFGMLIGIVIGA
ncbi:MAG TPA: hypothetical protein VLM88_00580, partial [Proteiniclasticum sp.]|nr:hypothetical protein [Proteiniclasticum sp.]